MFRDPNKLKYESLPSGCVSDVGNENKGRRGEKKRKKRRKRRKKKRLMREGRGDGEEREDSEILCSLS